MLTLKGIIRFTEAASYHLNDDSPRRKIIVKVILSRYTVKNNVKAKDMCQQVNIYCIVTISTVQYIMLCWSEDLYAPYCYLVVTSAAI